MIKKRARHALAILTITCAGHACSTSNSEQQAYSYSLKSFAALTNDVQTLIDTNQLAGASIAIERSNQLVYSKTLGLADIDSQTRTSPETLFRIHSMTKPIVAAIALMLADDGLLALQDPIAKYLPEFSKVKVFSGGSADAPILQTPDSAPTVHQLLNQTSGIAAFSPEHVLAERHPLEDLFANNPNLREYSQRVAQLPLAAQPGSEFFYGIGYDILGRVLEVASGQPLDTLLAQRLFHPLGMLDTFFIVPKHKRSRLASGYTRNADGALEKRQDEVYVMRWREANRLFSANGGLVSSKQDYLRFARLLMNRGVHNGSQLISAQSIERMTTVSIANADSTFLRYATPGYGYAYGVAVLQDVRASGKPGRIGEYFWGGAADTYFFVDPSEELIGLFFTQRYPAGQLGLRETLQSRAYESLSESNP